MIQNKNDCCTLQNRINTRATYRERPLWYFTPPPSFTHPVHEWRDKGILDMTIETWHWQPQRPGWDQNDFSFSLIASPIFSSCLIGVRFFISSSKQVRLLSRLLSATKLYRLWNLRQAECVGTKVSVWLTSGRTFIDARAVSLKKARNCTKRTAGC